MDLYDLIYDARLLDFNSWFEKYSTEFSDKLTAYSYYADSRYRKIEE